MKDDPTPEEMAALAAICAPIKDEAFRLIRGSIADALAEDKDVETRINHLFNVTVNLMIEVHFYAEYLLENMGEPDAVRDQCHLDMAEAALEGSTAVVKHIMQRRSAGPTQ